MSYMEFYPVPYIEVDILCRCTNPEQEEAEARIKQFTDLSIKIPENLLEQAREYKHEWRPGRLMMHNVEAYYPDAENVNTIIHLKSGGALTIKQNYETVKLLADGQHSP
jgi:hypothetical protein